jgi:ketosteroid isomerase-like protein
MSQQNVEIVRRAVEAFNTGTLDTWLEFLDPEIDYRAMEGALDDVGEMHGTEAMRRFVQDWLDLFEDFTVVAEELLDVGEDQVVAVLLLSGRAKLSGIETQVRYAVVYALRDEKIVRGREFGDRQQALQAIGLEG